MKVFCWVWIKYLASMELTDYDQFIALRVVFLFLLFQTFHELEYLLNKLQGRRKVGFWWLMRKLIGDNFANKEDMFFLKTKYTTCGKHPDNTTDFSVTCCRSIRKG